MVSQPSFRVVLDTNLLVSSLLIKKSTDEEWPVKGEWLRNAWKYGKIKPLVSRETKNEFLAVLEYKKFTKKYKLNETKRELIKNDYLPFCEFISIPNIVPPISKCRDKKDNPFLELGIVGHADALVTGDKDILELKDKFPIPILTCKELENILSGRSKNES